MPAKGARKGKGKAKKGGRKVRRSGNLPDMAKASVKRTITAAGGQNFLINQMYEVHNIALTQYDRAVNIAKAYQYFRIKKVALTVKFGYDTYTAGAGAPTRPNLYYMLDKSQSIPLNVSLEGLKQMGSRPHACDNKPFTISWAPSVLTQEDGPGGPLPAQYKISPWLNTNNANLGAFVPSAVNHNGLYWYVQMDATNGVVYNYTAELEVQFEFKKPLWTATTSSVSAIGIAPAVLNNSPDGIVGGADEAQDIGGHLVVPQ